MAYCARHGFIANDFMQIDRASDHDHAYMDTAREAGHPTRTGQK